MRESFLDVYIFDYDFNFVQNEIVEWRKQYINETKDKSKKDERLFTWMALDTACTHSLGVSINKFNPRRLPSKKVVIDKYYISLSNSGHRIMVAISSHPVGVDIQKVKDREPFYPNSQTWSDNERKELVSKDPIENTRIWAMKEALYKLIDPDFKWDETTQKLVDSYPYLDWFESDQIENQSYYWAVISELIHNLRPWKLYLDNTITKFNPKKCLKKISEINEDGEMTTTIKPHIRFFGIKEKDDTYVTILENGELITIPERMISASNKRSKKKKSDE